MKKYPKKEKVVKDFSPEARLAAIEARKTANARIMTDAEIAKYKAKKNVVASNKYEGMTMGEINRMNANNSLKS